MPAQSPIQKAQAAYAAGQANVVLFGTRLMVGYSATDLATAFEGGGIPVKKVDLADATAAELTAASVQFYDDVPMAKVTVTFRR